MLRLAKVARPGPFELHHDAAVCEVLHAGVAQRWPEDVPTSCGPDGYADLTIERSLILPSSPPIGLSDLG
jgi:hypothetical protein